MRAALIEMVASHRLVVVYAVFISAISRGGSVNSAVRPSVLFASPSFGETNVFIDLDYLMTLHNDSSLPLQVDYTSSLLELNRSRIFQYNALVLFHSVMSPGGTGGGCNDGGWCSDGYDKGWAPLISEYVSRGGGVLLFPEEKNVDGQQMFDLTELFGVKLPAESLVETDPRNLAVLDHAPLVPIAYTDRVNDSHPVGTGVRAVWHPIQQAYNAAQGGSLLLTDPAWTVIVHASTTVVTQNINLTKPDLPKPPAAQIYQRPSPIKSPPLFACRSYQKGRVCAMNQWPQFTVASGSKWIFHNQVLSAGSHGRPSGFGRLLTNTYHWLVEPSTAAGPAASGIGGFTNTPNSLQSPNESPAVVAQFDEVTWSSRTLNSDGKWPEYDVQKLEGVDPAPELARAPPGSPGFHRTKGIIGVRTAYSTGTGTVAEYAAAATKAGLQFVVFLDEYWLDGTGEKLMTPAILEQLAQDCVEHSTESLSLYPGFSMKQNIGNTMFAYGPTVNLPTDPKYNGPQPNGMMTPDNKLFMIQPIDPAAPANFTGYNGPSMNWCITGVSTGCPINPRAKQTGWTVGYYDLGPTRTPGSMAMYDLRGFSAAGLYYYDQTGKLVEDNTADYLLTSESTISPVPLVISSIGSPAALLTAVKSQYINNVLVYDMDNLFCHGLKWNSQYDSMPVYASRMQGPQINAISTGTSTARTYVVGNEKFVTGSSLLPFALDVNSTHPLKEVAVYSGTKLYRRFSFDGKATMMQRLLLLDEFIHKNLNVIVTDVAGNSAMGTTRRNWKPGSPRQIIYCGDHFNACDPTGVLLAHGPFSPQGSYVLPLPVDLAGGTWDGGPPPTLPLLQLEGTRPIIKTDAGTEDLTRFTQIPRLEYSDEGSVAITSLQNRVIDARVEQVVNEWHTFGPIAGASKIANATLRYREYYGPNLGIPETGYPGFALSQGTIATLFRSEITFKLATTVTDLQLVRSTNGYHANGVVLMAYAAAATGPISIFNATEGSNPESMSAVVNTGGWWAVWAPALSTNSHIWINRGLPVRIDAQATQSAGFFSVSSSPQNLSVIAGTTLEFELAQIGISMTQEIGSLADITKLIGWLDQPTGLVLARGVRNVRNGGLFDVAVDESFVAELSVSQHPATDMMLPLHVTGLQPRWSVGMWQFEGYTMGHYTNGKGVFTSLGLDDFNASFIPLYVGKVPKYHVSVGHPVVASGSDAAELVIQVTRVNATATNPIWHVSVNNPLQSRSLSVKLRVAMPELVGLKLPKEAASMTLDPGEFCNLL